jgi:hypothetical protein
MHPDAPALRNKADDIHFSSSIPSGRKPDQPGVLNSPETLTTGSNKPSLLAHKGLVSVIQVTNRGGRFIHKRWVSGYPDW